MAYAKTANGKARITEYKKTAPYLKWRKEHRQLERVRSASRKYSRSDKARQSQQTLRAKPDRKRYMSEYQKRPEQKAQRVLRKRAIEQHLSKNATPKWANLFFIGEIYDLAKRRTAALGLRFEVDHIIPLKGTEASGLHVENNLRVIPGTINRAKSNKIVGSLIG